MTWWYETFIEKYIIRVKKNKTREIEMECTKPKT